MKLVIFFCFILCVKNSLQRSTGAPPEACNNMTPQHGSFVPQQGDAQIEIIAPEWIVSRSVITVLIRSTNPNFLFRGFKIQARTQTGERIGRFLSGNAVGLVNCDGVPGSAATHIDSMPKSEVQIQWEVPDVAVPSVFIFIVTVVESFDVFWINQSTGLLPIIPEHMDTTTPNVPGETTPEEDTTPGLPGETTPPTTTTIGFDPPSPPTDESEIAGIFTGCGVSKTCFGIPDLCYRRGDCVSFTAVTYDSATETFAFELLSTANQNYIASGLSLSRSMPDASVIECVQGPAGVISAFASWTVERSSAQRGLVSQLLINMTNSVLLNGRIYCKVERAPIGDVNGIPFNLRTTEFYMLLASGTQVIPTGVLQHDTNRAVSANPVLLTTPTEVVADASMSALVLVHGSFMIVAWVGMTSIGIAVARYFKSSWPNRKACGGRDIWFVWHVICMFLTWALTLAGFIIIFVDLGEWITSPHAIMGCIVLALSIVQPFGAIFRPKPNDKARPLFNWFHRAFGNITHLLAIITIFFAVGLPRATLPHYTFYVLAAFASFYLFMHIVFTAVHLCGEMKKQKRLGRAISKDAPYKLLQKTLFVLFIVVVVLFTIALVLIFTLDFAD